MVDLWLGLGSNVGERKATLAASLHLLDKHGLRVAAVSSLYATAPQGTQDQPEFLNCVACTHTALEPEDALQTCRQIEDEFGRQRRERWGPRTLDVDLLLYDELHLSSSDLTLPHPRMWERAFVLVPLVELWPTLVTSDGERAAERLKHLLPRQPVRRIAGPDWWTR